MRQTSKVNRNPAPAAGKRQQFGHFYVSKLHGGRQRHKTFGLRFEPASFSDDDRLNACEILLNALASGKRVDFTVTRKNRRVSISGV